MKEESSKERILSFLANQGYTFAHIEAIPDFVFAFLEPMLEVSYIPNYSPETVAHFLNLPTHFSESICTDLYRLFCEAIPFDYFFQIFPYFVKNDYYRNLWTDHIEEFLSQDDIKQRALSFFGVLLRQGNLWKERPTKSEKMNESQEEESFELIRYLDSVERFKDIAFLHSKFYTFLNMQNFAPLKRLNDFLESKSGDIFFLLLTYSGRQFDRKEETKQKWASLSKSRYFPMYLDMSHHMIKDKLSHLYSKLEEENFDCEMYCYQKVKEYDFAKWLSSTVWVPPFPLSTKKYLFLKFFVTSFQEFRSLFKEDEFHNYIDKNGYPFFYHLIREKENDEYAKSLEETMEIYHSLEDILSHLYEVTILSSPKEKELILRSFPKTVQKRIKTLKFNELGKAEYIYKSELYEIWEKFFCNRETGYEDLLRFATYFKEHNYEAIYFDLSESAEWREERTSKLLIRKNRRRR